MASISAPLQFEASMQQDGQRRLVGIRAFSSEVDTGSREENT